MAGKICVGAVVVNPSLREGRAYADGVEARMNSATPGDYPLTGIDTVGEAAWDQGVADAAAGVPATSCTCYAGQTGPA